MNSYRGLDPVKPLKSLLDKGWNSIGHLPCHDNWNDIGLKKWEDPLQE